MSAPLAAVDALLADRYRLSGRIAVGGMGEVWRAHDLVLDREVAVKTLRADLVDDEHRARFRAEARHAARLSHPGIASVYDFGELPEHAWLVLELVAGEALSEVLRREAPLPVDRVLDVLGQAAAALQAAHDRGVVHRDVKPGNLLVRPDGVVKVTDFGIASAGGTTTMTRTGQIVGTAGYLSPEQAGGGTATPSSDLYALGVVTYECLVGARPFVSDTPVAVLFMHLHAPPPPLPDTVPDDVRSLVLSMLAKDPADRPRSAGAVEREAARLRRRGAPAAAPTRVLAAGSRPRGDVAPVPTPPRPTAAPVGGLTSRRSQRNAVRATTVLLAALAVVLGLWGPLADETTQVPRIEAGTPVGEAEASLTDAGLRPVRREQQSAGVAAGGVVTTRPAAGVELDEGDRVVLLVSSGPAPAEDPVPAQPEEVTPRETGPAPAPEEGSGAEPTPGADVPAPAPGAEQGADDGEAEVREQDQDQDTDRDTDQDTDRDTDGDPGEDEDGS